ncbi:hypothetical protein FACS1894208_06280 [Clostridia bacterium]|nr:hypothetical protein FACS1894208_06280 [Clostridia bacterium]
MQEATVSEFGKAIFSDIDQNVYLNEIYGNILYNYAVRLFKGERAELKEVNISDALRFSDILSKSTDFANSDKHKIWAQEIVALLNVVVPGNQDIALYMNSVLSSTGNYRGLSLAKPQSELGFTVPKSPSLLDSLFSEFLRDYMRIPAEPEYQFFRTQREVYDRLSGTDFSYSGPTSMGKSFVMRMFIKKQIQDGQKLNFALIVPTKALINEVSSRIIKDLQNLLAEQNYKVVTSPGALALNEKHNFIYVLTPERLLYLLIGNEDVKIDYLFIDEAHKISSRESRSAFYYKVIDMLGRREHKPHVIFASPNIPNPEIYLKLVTQGEPEEQQKLATTFATVSQIKFLVDFHEGAVKVYDNYCKELINVCGIEDNTFEKFITRIGKKSQNIIYCSSIAKAIEQAVGYAEHESVRNDMKLLTLSKDIGNDVHGDYYLSKIVKKGVAYHIGYLPSAIRMRIEQAFSEGLIHTIFCTSTLLEGVNLPADNLVITSYKSGTRKMDVVDFRNLIGRVGRIEFNLYGNVFLVRIPEDKKFKTSTYVELLKADVPEQSLSVVEGLSEEQKKIIVDSLAVGDIELNTTIKVKDDDYITMRKFAMILLRDITKDNNSFVRRAFATLLQGDTEERIKAAFSKSPNEQDDDINVSIDQSNRLMAAIAGGLKYPFIDSEGYVDYDELMNFLERLCAIFKWERYEKDTLGFKGANGGHGRLRWYGIILSQWVKGDGLRFIMEAAIRYKQTNRNRALWYNFKSLDYDDSPFHRNIVIAQTLEAIERVILFSVSNYFLKFSEAYKRYHKTEGDMDNDWYEFVEYGTTNRLSIMFQRHGFSRETATFIRHNRDKYVVNPSTAPKLKKSIATCGNISVENEVADVMFNVPELFVE